MTNDEINTSISAWFEPKPEGTPKQRPYDRNSSHDDRNYSPKGAWWHCPYFDDVWHSDDYFTSEDANARLLEAMPRPNLHKANDGTWVAWYDRDLWAQSDDEETPDPVPLNHDWFGNSTDRKTAVVLAFLQFAGIAHKHDGGEE